MRFFFKAWAIYSGILIKLAPGGLQGELATALSIYTANLYDLLEKYTLDGVKSYHFQFHRKRVASGKIIYEPRDWHQLDSLLVASKCFQYPVQRANGQPFRNQPPHRPEEPTSYHLVKAQWDTHTQPRARQRAHSSPLPKDG